MSIPQRHNNQEFEQLATGDFINGVIDEVQEDMEHKFKGYQGAEDTVQPAVRFIFKFDGYKHKHYSRWMKFSYHEKSNLFIKYISNLVQDANPEMLLDIQILTGFPIKAIWKDDKNGFQSVELIKPLKNKMLFKSEPEKSNTFNVEAITLADEDETLPF